MYAPTRLKPLTRELEGWAEPLAGTFPQWSGKRTVGVCNDGLEPGSGLVMELEGRAEALADTFNLQDVASTLWAYATMRQ